MTLLQQFQPPPVYTQRTIRTNQLNNVNANSQQPPNAMRPLQQIHRDRMLQQQQKERLLQQQQKQSLVVPVNATAGADQICKIQLFLIFRHNLSTKSFPLILDLNPGMSNYDTLLNNVPPNVSLQRSTNTVPDSQLSSSLTSNIMQQQLSPSPARAPFSPQTNQGYQPYTNTGQRLSPQQQLSQQQLNQQQLKQQQQQQQMAFQTGTNATSNPQLSPRQPPFPQGTPNSQQTQPNQPQNPQQQQWNQAARLTVQQQQNPMLNAQLQVI